MNQTPGREPEDRDQLPEDQGEPKASPGRRNQDPLFPKPWFLPYVGLLCLLMGGVTIFMPLKYENLFSSGDKVLLLCTGGFSSAVGIYLITFWFRRS